jgi:hypothetical protein
VDIFRTVCYSSNTITDAYVLVNGKADKQHIRHKYSGCIEAFCNEIKIEECVIEDHENRNTPDQIFIG